MSRLWISGYRGYELGIFSDKDEKLNVVKFAIKQNLIQHIENGTDWLITGAQLGVEQWAVEVASELKGDYPELKIAVMLPFADFGVQWNETNQSRLTNIINLADFSDQVSDSKYHSPQQLKNYQSFMLTHTDEAVLIYDEEHEGKSQFDLRAIQGFQESHPYPLTLVDFDELQENAEEYSEQIQRNSKDS